MRVAVIGDRSGSSTIVKASTAGPTAPGSPRSAASPASRRSCRSRPQPARPSAPRSRLDLDAELAERLQRALAHDRVRSPQAFVAASFAPAIFTFAAASKRAMRVWKRSGHFLRARSRAPCRRRASPPAGFAVGGGDFRIERRFFSLSASVITRSGCCAMTSAVAATRPACFEPSASTKMGLAASPISPCPVSPSMASSWTRR